MSRMNRSIVAVAFLLITPVAAKADVVLDWNAIMMTTIGGQNPFAQARFAAITQLAVFEAVNAISGDHEAYLGTVAAPAGASAEAAAVAAAHRILRTYFPANGAALDAARAGSLAAIPDGQSKEDGIAVGESAAAAMIALRSADGSMPPQVFVPSSTAPGVWQPTPPAFGPGIFFHWRSLATFGIESSRQFRAGPPPSLASNEYRKDYDEVMEVGRSDSAYRPADRTAVASFFNIASAPHVWNSAARQASAVQNRSLSENARTFALLNMAISDGLVSSMESKYFYQLWRPVTAIRNGDADGNPDTYQDETWSSLIATPSFPGYPSAHASGSYAAARIAQKIFGAGGHAITLTHPGLPTVTLQYSAFHDICADIDDARVFGGIHFRFDQEAGARQGHLVGSYIHKHWLRPLAGDDE